MRNVTMLLIVFAFMATTAQAQTLQTSGHVGPEASTEFFLTVDQSDDFKAAYARGLQGGARAVSGSYDLDNDGKMEMIFTDYTGGGRFHIVEATGVDTYELVYSSPWLDSTNTSANARFAAGGDLDGDGVGEIIITCGAGYDYDDKTAPSIITGIGICVWEAQGDNDYGTEPVGFYDFGDYTPDRWRAEQIVVMDVDGDLQQEVLIGNNGSAGALDIWYVVSVTGLFGTGIEVWNNELILTSRADDPDPVARGGGSPYGINAGDLDGDGGMELIMTSWNNFNFAVCDVTGPNSYVCPTENANVQAGEGDHVNLFGPVVVDINGDGDDEAFAPRLNSYFNQAVTVVNYEDGEDAGQITADNIVLDVIAGPNRADTDDNRPAGLTNLGLTAGDIDGDGNMDLIGAGWEHIGSDQSAGNPSYFLHVASWVGGEGGNPEDPDNYVIRKIPTPSDLDTTFLDIVYRDSSGTMTKYYETSGGIYFPPKLAFLGDVDGDGHAEVAASFQGVSDSTFIYDELYVESVATEAGFVTDPTESQYLGTGSTERSVAYNPDTDNVYVASRANGNNIAVFDAADGEELGVLTPPAGGYTGGTFALNQVAVTSDGQIFASNLATSPATSPFKVYYWAHEDSTGQVIFESTLDMGTRYGDSFSAFWGENEAGEETIYLVSSGGGGNTKVVVLAYKPGDDMATVDMYVDIQAEAARGGFASFDAQDGVWINGRGTEIQLVDIDENGDSFVAASIPSSMVPSSAMGLTGFEMGDRLFLVAGPADGKFYVAEVTDPAAPRLIGMTDALGDITNASGLGGVAYDTERDHLIGLNTNNGIGFFPVMIGYERSTRETVGQDRIFGRVFSLGGESLPNEDEVASPDNYALGVNYPNPFTQQTRISFTLQQPAEVSLKVYDALGRLVRTLVPADVQYAGEHTVTWNGRNDAGQTVASGVYFYTLDTPSGRLTEKMVMVR